MSQVYSQQAWPLSLLSVQSDTQHIQQVVVIKWVELLPVELGSPDLPARGQNIVVGELTAVVKGRLLEKLVL